MGTSCFFTISIHYKTVGFQVPGSCFTWILNQIIDIRERVEKITKHPFIATFETIHARDFMLPELFFYKKKGVKSIGVKLEISAVVEIWYPPWN